MPQINYRILDTAIKAKVSIESFNAIRLPPFEKKWTWFFFPSDAKKRSCCDTINALLLIIRRSSAIRCKHRASSTSARILASSATWPTPGPWSWPPWRRLFWSTEWPHYRRPMCPTTPWPIPKTGTTPGSTGRTTIPGSSSTTRSARIALRIPPRDYRPCSWLSFWDWPSSRYSLLSCSGATSGITDSGRSSSSMATRSECLG